MNMLVGQYSHVTLEFFIGFGLVLVDTPQLTANVP
jgi:hypothetical protein